MKRNDLENRLIKFAVEVLTLVEMLPQQPGAKHMGSQLMRSATSPALNYGEAQSGESKADFIHKMKVCLKELRESHVALRIIHQKNYVEATHLNGLLNENNQLISIFVASIVTAERNRNSENT